MAAQIIDGKTTAKTIREEIAAEVSAGTDGGARPPGLAVIIVGEDPASQSYVRGKKKAAEAAGFHSEIHVMPADTTREDLLARVDQLNSDPKIDGFLVQSPLPGHLDEQEVVLRIDPAKDADGFHPINMGRLAIGLPGYVPCTPLGCIELLIRHGIETSGKHAVVIGRSHIVGTPMALLLMRKGEGGNATVTVCHSRTSDLAAECRRADIVVAAIGKPGFVTGDMIKEGAVVIDVGINRVDAPETKKGYRLVGDVDYEAAAKKASWITPVPGGVGPMTIAILLKNTLTAWKQNVG